jgi:hypothetical protein
MTNAGLNRTHNHETMEAGHQREQKNAFSHIQETEEQKRDEIYRLLQRNK